jgi:hypothetical protein
MKKLLGMLGFCGLLALGAQAQEKQDKPAQDGPQGGPKDGPLVGGYSKASVKDKEVVDAAQFAVKEQAKKTNSKIELIKVVRADRQVVAGMNYKLRLEIKTGEQLSLVNVVVWKKLDGTHALTDWKAHMPKTKKQ